MGPWLLYKIQNMIQRIQSLWLLLASLSCFASLRMPFYSGVDKTGQPHILTATDGLILMILTVAGGLLALISIFLFKQRKIQVRMSVAGIFIQLIVLVLYYREYSSYQSGALALTSLLPGLVIFFLFFAIRAIGKDIDLLKSSDRLR